MVALKTKIMRMTTINIWPVNCQWSGNWQKRKDVFNCLRQNIHFFFQDTLCCQARKAYQIRMGLHVQICLLGRLRVLFRCVTCSRARSFLRVFSPLPLYCQRIATSPQGGGRFFFQIKQISYLCFYDRKLFLSSLFVEDDVYLRAVLEADYPYRPFPPS